MGVEEQSPINSKVGGWELILKKKLAMYLNRPIVNRVLTARTTVRKRNIGIKIIEVIV